MQPIKLYRADNNSAWSNDTLQHMLALLPLALQEKALAYKSWQQRQARILGKHLLLDLLLYFKVKYTLAQLKYTPQHKPCFTLNLEPDFDFSIAHAGEIVACAATLNAKIGLDIEKTQAINLEDYREQLTDNEWQFIQNADDSTTAFYHIWTRKEALLKAIGRGIETNFNSIDVTENSVFTEGKEYTFITLKPAKGYIAHIATYAPFDSGSVFFERPLAEL